MNNSVCFVILVDVFAVKGQLEKIKIKPKSRVAGLSRTSLKTLIKLSRSRKKVLKMNVSRFD